MTFEEEFKEFLEPFVIGKVNLQTGEWTLKHEVDAFLENLRGQSAFISQRDQVELSGRVFLPTHDKEDNPIELDSTFYIAKGESFDMESSQKLYKVVDGQKFDYYQYVYVETSDI